MKKNLNVFQRKNWSFCYIVFLLFFVVAPLFLIVFYSFNDEYGNVSLYNFEKFARQAEAVSTFVYSIWIAFITTSVCLLIAYPVAFILSKREYSLSKIFIILFIIPMWINMLIRTLATVAIFDFFKLPLKEGALIFGMVYNFLPFMILPIYNNLTKIDYSLIEAAQDLGANSKETFWKIIFPLSFPGISSGITMVFMPTISTFAISEILTMNSIRLFGTTIQENMNNGLWNYGSALSLIMLIIIGISMLLQSNNSNMETNKNGNIL